MYCNDTLWRAYRIRGYWVGYEKDKNISEKSLYTGNCPYDFCLYNDSLLPDVANAEELNQVVCTATRTGTLCGQCREEYSVFYHSLYFSCKKNRYCKFGWLFYILSELVPVTTIFLVIVIFNVNFTSGSMNGFIFYSQVVVLLQITAGNSIPFPPAIQNMIKILQFLYQNFNLSTFVLDQMSFCLFDGATALDIIAFDYITLIYSFLLLIGIVLLINKLSLRQCCKPLRKCTGTQWWTLQGSIIHGLTGFLVLSYGKCIQTSLSLIILTSIKGMGGKHEKYVVYFNGEIDWLDNRHLPYAIPAIIMLIVFLSLPLLLLMYPAHHKILSTLKMSDTKYARKLCNYVEKLRPFLDSFQGSFKDEFRFFSGLYFLYRCLFNLNIIFRNFQEIYFFFSVQLLLMLLLHTICQPYKKRLHNIVDTLLFLNLAMINVLSLYNFSSMKSEVKSSSSLAGLGMVQVTLIALPFLVIVVVSIWRLLKYWKRKFNDNQDKDAIILDDIVHERLDNSEEVSSSCYKIF